MSSFVATALGTLGLQALNILAPGAPSRSIGGIIAQVTIEEVERYSTTITEHPVEVGANVSDHAYINPTEVVLRVGWSNSGYAALGGALAALSTAQSLSQVIGDFTSPAYVTGIYNQLLNLWLNKIPFTIVTGKQQHTNMLIRDMTITTNVDTENGLIATISCRHLFFATTTTTTIPDNSVAANPQNTSSPVPTGQAQASSASANNGGFIPSNVVQSQISQVPLAPPSGSAVVPGVTQGTF